MPPSDTEAAEKPDFYPSEEPTAVKNEEELDDDIGDVNMDELGNKVWLVKVPEFLAEKWKQPREDGVQLGKIRIYDRPDKSGSNISIILGDTSEYQDIPKEYRMQVTNEKVKNMFIFSEDRNPLAVVKPTSLEANKAVPIAMTGTVHHECTVMPKYTEEYKRIMRMRVLDRHKNSRKVQRMEETHSRSMLAAESNTFDTAQKKQKTADSRTTRMDRQQLMNRIFAGFEKFPYWSFKGLLEHTRQPSAYLKEVLADIAKLNKSGPYANMYSLKPEFRKASAEAAAAAVAAAATSAAKDGADAKESDDEDLDIDDEDDFEDV